MENLYFLGIVFCLLHHSFASRCFQCQNVPFPRDCTKVTECSADQYCFTEQVVTMAGNVVFNSGCLHHAHCSPTGMSLIGKRSVNSRRSTDITTCIECCKDDFCNRNGCGTSEVPLTQRGPYCFNCDTSTDAKACHNVTVCDENELCMLYSPVKYDGLPQTIYKAQCESQSICDIVSKALHNPKCAPICCKTDFCNDHCGMSSNDTMTTAHPRTSIPTTETTEVLRSATTQTKHPTGVTAQSTVPSNNAQFHCDSHGHYIHLRDANAQLCVHIVHNHAIWDDARHACRQEGGDLVVLETHEKALLMRNELIGTGHKGFWIGARDFNRNNHHLWTDNYLVDDSEADWGLNQPDHFSHGVNQDCVAITVNSYHWNDIDCESHLNYICERR
ncbi:uncharacterized protein LOC128546898 [Mercenaria mercenaria]|uniref:uncharacterized protein LOC128546898 n=1 Tax=Mercenaria mercenaria TaxID=6596 RepID=UPI00234EF08B|nr:uncharacterized protein LOC128546898 [Mercenaria mercenaria]